MYSLHLVNSSCNSCNNLAKSYLSVIDDDLAVGNQLIDKFELTVGVRNYQGLEHVENVLFGSIPPSLREAYYVDLLQIGEDYVQLGPNLTFKGPRITRGPYLLGFVRNVGFGTNNVLAFTSPKEFGRFLELMNSLAFQGHMALPFHVSYS